MGTSKIANHLNSIGIKPRKNNYWSDSTIRDILRNPVYIGKIRWNWRKTVKTYKDGEIVCSRPKSTPDSWIIIDGKHNGNPVEPFYIHEAEYVERFADVLQTDGNNRLDAVVG